MRIYFIFEFYVEEEKWYKGRRGEKWEKKSGNVWKDISKHCWTGKMKRKCFARMVL